MYVAPEVGPEIYIGSLIAVLPIFWGAIEFYKRIKTQRECLLCTGSGLVYVTPSGNKLTRPRKCYSCGGFIPWLGWKMVSQQSPEIITINSKCPIYFLISLIPPNHRSLYAIIGRTLARMRPKVFFLDVF